MDGTLCVDFGTSSIRAALRVATQGHTQRATVLPIGRAQGGTRLLDDASIPSAIFVREGSDELDYGDKAMKLALSDIGARDYLEISPKRWLTSPREFDTVEIPRLGLTRRHLLTGLLASAMAACQRASGLTYQQMMGLDLRNAHPIWPMEAQATARKALNECAFIALRLLNDNALRLLNGNALRAEAFITSFDRLKGQLNGVERNMLEVREPVAAAVELFEHEGNALFSCLVVDVGAGTTDLALISAIIPSERAGRTDIFNLHAAESVFSAGDELDQIVLDAFKAKAPADKLTAISVRSAESRRRGIKQNLFTYGRHVEFGVELTVDEIERSDRAVRMACKIRKQAEDLVARVASTLLQMMHVSNPVHRMRQLNVVMAGGGANLGFVQTELKLPFRTGTEQITVEIGVPREIRGVNYFGAGRARMAVALGGTVEKAKWPRNPPTAIHHSLGLFPTTPI